MKKNTIVFINTIIMLILAAIVFFYFLQEEASIRALNPAGIKLYYVHWIVIIGVLLALVILFAINLIYYLQQNREMKKLANEAIQASDAKTFFLATMSHDVRTPLNAILGMTELASHNIDDKEQVADCLRKIKLSGGHLLTLINDVLDISKVESGQYVINPVNFSVAEEVETFINLIQPMVDDKKQDFDFLVYGILHEELYGDQLRFNQIMINLLSNAVRYTPEGGKIQCSMTMEPTEQFEKVKVICRVEDNGIGMTPEFQKQMYQPFARAIDSRIAPVSGTGLGLAITKNMVELLDGTIECQSEIGKGTTFTVSVEMSVGSQKGDKVMLPEKRVLVIDDDIQTRKSGVELLQELGLKTHAVESSNDLIKTIESAKADGYPYEIVTCTSHLSGIDGKEVTRKLHERFGNELKIVLIAEHTEMMTEEDLKNAGADTFIRKPVFKSYVYRHMSNMMGLASEINDQKESSAVETEINVIVAEDNDMNWEVISSLLALKGVNCTRATNGLEAVRAVEDGQENQFDLVFMDIQMPEMTGLEATRTLRNSDKSDYVRNIPIIAMSADAFAENVQECMKAGMDGHIPKPVNMRLVDKELKKIREKKIKK